MQFVVASRSCIQVNKIIVCTSGSSVALFIQMPIKSALVAVVELELHNKQRFLRVCQITCILGAVTLIQLKPNGPKFEVYKAHGLID